MKTYKNLYSQIYDFENLRSAFCKARRGKRQRPEVAAFEYHLEEELWRLHGALRDKTYTPGPYRHFYIIERKKRKISAAPFRDRVVHHALCAIIEPLFERRFIYDSYACRKEKGVHRAADRAQVFARQNAYVFKGDVRQFFPSVDHALLRERLARLIGDPDVLWLCDRILATGAGVLESEYEMQWFPNDDLWAVARARGLPIGNQTSQFWGNVYLDSLDQFIKRTLKCRGYVRYADDILLFHPDKRILHQWRQAIDEHLATLRLVLHPRKAIVSPTRDGFDFVGYRIFPTHRRLRKDNVRAFARRLRGMRHAYWRGELTLKDIQPRVKSWVAHAKHADTYRLRQRLFAEVVF